MKNIKQFLLITGFLMVPALFAHQESDIKDKLEASIKVPGTLSMALSSVVSNIAYYTPKLVGAGFDQVGSWMLSGLFYPSFAQNQIKKFAFKGDDEVFAKYDGIIGVHRVIPHDPVPTQTIHNLIESAKSERKHWADGRMSGGVYDGSEEHMSMLADIFERSMKRDKYILGFDIDDKEASSIANEAFHHFHTSNPLHGTMFPLSVKAMREISSMLSGLIEKKHGIVSSGANEALRIGLRALKNRYARSGRCLIMANQENELLTIVSKTINAQVVNDFSGVSFAAYMQDSQDLQSLIDFLGDAQIRGVAVHVHLEKNAFKSLFSSDDLIEALRSPAVASVSYDTTGVIFQGVSATVFANEKARFDALESHIDWPGGVYPGINAAGSLPGVDYILAYLLALYQGKVGLAKLANKTVPEGEIIDNDFDDKWFKKRIIDFFYRGGKPDEIVELLDRVSSLMRKEDYRKLIEDALVALNLSIFKAQEGFFGTITSGGTESIRQAIQLYSNRFKIYKPNDRPIFLMTDTAHIAFDRHMKDLDAVIVRINKDHNHGMDPDHLQSIISHFGASQIAGIIVSTPNFPYGTTDNVAAISDLAVRYNIPLHVDACLGAYVLQFLSGEHQLFLNNPVFKGVTSWSADLHKYGVARKGLSSFYYKNSLQRYRGLSPAICTMRSTAQIEQGLISMLKIGNRGYSERAQKIISLSQELLFELNKTDGIEVIAPLAHNPRFVIAFRMSGTLKSLTYTLGSYMSKLGWHLSTMGEHTLHIAVTNAHTQDQEFLKKFMDDLRYVVQLLQRNPKLKQSSSVGIYGMAADLSVGSFITGKKSKEVFLKTMIKLYADNLLTVK